MRANDAEFVFRVEVVIDARIVLVAVYVGSVSVHQVKTLDAPAEPDERRIQAISRRFARGGIGKFIG